MMKCKKDCRMYYREWDGYGYRGYQCLVSRQDTYEGHDCPFWDKTIAEISEMNDLYKGRL